MAWTQDDPFYRPVHDDNNYKTEHPKRASPTYTSKVICRQFHQHSTYERRFGSFFYVYVTRAAKTTLVRKIRTENVDEIDTLSLSTF